MGNVADNPRMIQLGQHAGFAHQSLTIFSTRSPRSTFTATRSPVVRVSGAIDRRHHRFGARFGFDLEPLRNDVASMHVDSGGVAQFIQAACRLTRKRSPAAGPRKRRGPAVAICETQRAEGFCHTPPYHS